MTAKDLKNALLQEAVQGKLVPQIASEGNARDLLEEIRKSRGESLPLATARKRSSATPSAGTPRNASMEITEDEIPFDIPESWCWCRLGDVTSLITDGKHGGGILQENSGFYFLSAKDIQNGELLYARADQITKEDFDNTHKRTNLEPGDICIVNTGGTIGKLAIAPNNEKTYRTTFQKSVAIIKPINAIVCNLYIAYYLQFDLKNLVKISGGSAIHNLLLSDMKKEVFPLPPLAEQKRIVAAIEKFMPLIEEYGKKETVLNELNAQIGTLTKKAILQEAVQGKLVPQIPAEGNAKDLLEQIKAHKAALIKEGKIKKEKPLPEITEDEIQFDIPENWCWCRLGEICQIINGFTPSRTNADFWNGTIPWFTIDDIRNQGRFISYTSQFITEKALSKDSERIVPADSVLLCCTASVGEFAYTKIALTTNQQFNALPIRENYKDIVYTFYLFYFVQTLKDKLIGDSGKTTFNFLSVGKLSNMLIPLPPLSEQKRIVAAIEHLLPLCEKLGK